MQCLCLSLAVNRVEWSYGLHKMRGWGCTPCRGRGAGPGIRRAHAVSTLQLSEGDLFHNIGVAGSLFRMTVLAAFAYGFIAFGPVTALFIATVARNAHEVITMMAG